MIGRVPLGLLNVGALASTFSANSVNAPGVPEQSCVPPAVWAAGAYMVRSQLVS